MTITNRMRKAAAVALLALALAGCGSTTTRPTSTPTTITTLAPLPSPNTVVVICTAPNGDTFAVTNAECPTLTADDEAWASAHGLETAPVWTNDGPAWIDAPNRMAYARSCSAALEAAPPGYGTVCPIHGTHTS